MKVELRGGEIIAGENPYYEIGWDDPADPNKKIRVFFDKQQEFDPFSAFKSGLFTRADLKEALVRKWPVRYTLVSEADVNDQRFLVSGVFKPKVRLFEDHLAVDTKETTGFLLGVIEGWMINSYRSAYLAILEPKQFVASSWFSDEDEDIGIFGSLRPHRNIVLNANGHLVRSKVNERLYEKIKSGDLEALAEIKKPSWKKILGL